MKEIINNNFNNQINDLKKIISYNSVNTNDHPPFSEEIQKCLEFTLKTFESHGFKTFINKDGYYGYAEIGEGELIGVLCHLDVVSASKEDNWINNPFELYIENNIAYGRGVQDDKGPIIASLYAMISLMQSNIKFNKRFRFIFGTDEELFWRCIKEYKKNEEIPKYGFAPDAIFPGIKAEKGNLQIKIFTKNETSLRFKGGTALNIVPNKMKYPKEFQKYVNENKYENKNNELIGKSVHAQHNHLGINVINRYLKLVSYDYHSKIASFVNELILEDPKALKIFGPLEDFSGHLSFNIGKIDFNELEEIYVDIRFPVTYELDYILKKLEVLKKYDLEYEIYDYLAPLNVDENSFIAKNLKKSYFEITNDDSELLVTGGATYARAFDNFIAFGANFNHSKKMAHQVNECLDLNDFKQATLIYANAFYNLNNDQKK